MITADISPKEITLLNRSTEHIFNRFDIAPNCTEGIKTFANSKELNSDFLKELLNVYCGFKNYDYEVFNSYPIPVIIDYLTRSHNYYMVKILPEIGQSISILLQNYDSKHPLLNILSRFYYDYKTELQKHFGEEESNLFPYAKALYAASVSEGGRTLLEEIHEGYFIKDFINDHDDTVEDLSAVKNIILEYNPPKTNQSRYRILIDQLANFEHDLHVHAFIEDQVLVPKLYLLESELS